MPGRGRRVDLGVLARYHPQSDVPFGQFLHNTDEVMQVASEAVELSHHQRIALGLGVVS